MKVANCEKCPYCVKRGWSSYCQPAGYHAIGVPHTYRYCNLHKKRCLEVKKCEHQQEIVEKSITFKTNR